MAPPSRGGPAVSTAKLRAEFKARAAATPSTPAEAAAAVIAPAAAPDGAPVSTPAAAAAAVKAAAPMKDITTRAIQADPRSVSKSVALPPTAEEKAAAAAAGGGADAGGSTLTTEAAAEYMKSLAPGDAAAAVEGEVPAEGAAATPGKTGKTATTKTGTGDFGAPSVGGTVAVATLTGLLFLVSGWAAYKLYNAPDGR